MASYVNVDECEDEEFTVLCGPPRNGAGCRAATISLKNVRAVQIGDNTMQTAVYSHEPGSLDSSVTVLSMSKEFPETKEAQLEDFIRRMDDIRLKDDTVDIPKTNDEIMTVALGTFQPPPSREEFSRDVNTGKCICHGEYSRIRCCFDVTEKTLDEDHRRLMKQIREEASRAEIHGCRRLIRLIFSYAAHIVKKDFKLDYVLGKMYALTNKNYEVDPVQLYSTWADLDTMYFFKENTRDIKRTVRTVYEWYGHAMPNNLVSVVLFLDQIGNSCGETRESVLGIMIRLSGAITAFFSKKDCGGDIYLKVLKIDRHMDMFRTCLSYMLSGAVALPLPTAANMGLPSKLPMCHSIVGRFYNEEPEDIVEENVKCFARMMANGIPVAVNVTRTTGDAILCLRYLMSQCDLLNDLQKVRAGARFYFDLWNVYSIRILDLILNLKPDVSTNVSFAVNVPDIAMRRSRSNGERWTFFTLGEGFGLADSTVETFDTVYGALEEQGRGMSVSMSWVMHKIAAAVMTGRLAVVFCDSVARLSPLDGLGGHAEVLGVDVASLGTSVLLSVPVYKVFVNLADFVEEVVPDSVKNDHNMFISYNCCYFNLRRLREVTSWCVCVMNATMESDLASHDAAVSEEIKSYRGISIDVTGFHSALQKMGLSFEHADVSKLNIMIFESMYYAALRTSVDLCINGLAPCAEFSKSIYKRGILHFDRFKDVNLTMPPQQWIKLRHDVAKYGCRNLSFLSVSPEGLAHRLLGVSPSVCPYRGGLDEETVIHKKPVVLDDMNPSVEESAASALCALREEDCRLKLPVANPVMSNLPEDILKDILRGKLSRVNPEYSMYFPGYSVCKDKLLQLYRDREPFVDQCQAPSLYVPDAVTPNDVVQYLIDVNQRGLRVGVYKCYVGAGGDMM